MPGLLPAATLKEDKTTQKKETTMDEAPVIQSADTQREDRVPPGQRVTQQWPVLHHGAVPMIDPAEWSFKAFGLVETPKELSFEEFLALTRVRVASDIHCVTTWSRLNNLWGGVATKEIARIARPLPNARFVLVHAFGGFSANLPLEEFLAEDALFALTHDGKPLTPEHGYPVRLVVPRLYFWKSAKWVAGVEFVEHDIPGFWESVGYHNHGDPWKEERYGR